MAKFTHRQDSPSSYTSVCMTCFRVVATRERESDLRADEAVHSCKVALPGAKPDPTYWGVGCRTCKELIAFGTTPDTSSGVGAVDSRPGTIRCTQGHTHIYFPRDFRQASSEVAIAEATLEENVRVYKALNPTWDSSSDAATAHTFLRQERKKTNDEALDAATSRRPASLLPDPRRENARRAAQQRWQAWAQKKIDPAQ